MKDQISYDAIGNSTTAATLTAAFTGNTKTLLCKYLKGLTLDIKYIPKAGQTNRYVEIDVEVSNDDGTTYFPITTKANQDTIINVYDGMYITFPGDQTTTGGTTYSGSQSFNITGDYVKIQARESGSDNFGTLYLRTTLTTEAIPSN